MLARLVNGSPCAQRALHICGFCARGAGGAGGAPSASAMPPLLLMLGVMVLLGLHAALLLPGTFGARPLHGSTV